MSTYQIAKIAELNAIGWSASAPFITGYIFRMTNPAGMRAYIYMVDIKCIYRDNSESLPLENYANECERELLRLAFKADHKLSQYGMPL